jgi:hypothetical protein
MFIDKIYNENAEWAPDYKEWINMPYWTHRFTRWYFSEPILLLYNYDPRGKGFVIAEDKLLKDMSANNDDQQTDIRCKIDSICDFLERAITSKELPSDTIMNDPNLNPHRVGQKQRSLMGIELNEIDANRWDNSVKEYQIKPRDFITWANDKGFKIPDPLRALLEIKLPEGTPPYLDPSHKYFSKELAIAIEAWMAIYGEDKLDPYEPSHKRQIEKWLDKHDYFLNNKNSKYKTIERIATIVNVYKKRGTGINNIINKNKAK